MNTSAHSHADLHHHHHDFHTHHGSALLLPFVLTLIFAVVEALGGWLTGSLALLGDASHMFSDSAALGLACLANWFARRPHTSRHNFGYLRAEVLVAMLNAAAMLLVVSVILYEAWQRLQQPQPILAGEMMLIALLGLLINLYVVWYLHRDSAGHSNINQRAAFLHVLGDLLGSLAALLSGAVIYLTGWLAIDAWLSVFIVLLICVASVRLLREGWHVLMEAVPHHLQQPEIMAYMRAVAGVAVVHEVKVWAISSEHIALTAHIKIADMQQWPELLARLQSELRSQFAIQYIVLQPELLAGQPPHHHAAG